MADELLKIAKRCAAKMVLSKRGNLPALDDIEDECEGDIEELLALLQEDEALGDVDLIAQQKLVDQIEAALPADRKQLIDALADQHAGHVWVQQIAAYYLGIAVGMKFAGSAELEDDYENEDEEEEGLDEEEEEDEE